MVKYSKIEKIVEGQEFSIFLFSENLHIGIDIIWKKFKIVVNLRILTLKFGDVVVMYMMSNLKPKESNIIVGYNGVSLLAPNTQKEDSDLIVVRER